MLSIYFSRLTTLHLLGRMGWPSWSLAAVKTEGVSKPLVSAVQKCWSGAVEGLKVDFGESCRIIAGDVRLLQYEENTLHDIGLLLVETFQVKHVITSSEILHEGISLITSELVPKREVFVYFVAASSSLIVVCHSKLLLFCYLGSSLLFSLTS